MKAAVRSQREYGRRRGSAVGNFGIGLFVRFRIGEYGYRAFGVPELAHEEKRYASAW